MTSLRRRISELENRVLKLPEFGTTRLILEDPTEIALLKRCMLITRSIEVGDELFSEQMALLHKLSEIALIRTVDLFCRIVGRYIHGGHPSGERLFLTWLLWFLQESSIGITQAIAEARIFDQKGKTWKQKEKEAEEFHKSWVKIFTRQRFEDYIINHIPSY